MRAAPARAAGADGGDGPPATYVSARRELQYREPALTDALLNNYPSSPQLVALAQTATEATEELLEQGRVAGVVRADFTAIDLYYADVANGLALRTAAKPDKADYDRRTRFLLDSLRPPPGRSTTSPTT